ncbi:hypothetical protein N0B44_30275 [Roseibacterium beibuensis]|uniref:hypothetical protein n=1 Tax=[Roseibacterium] beibuensis TaxID=1193142 RepID=UPI00217D728F|nr:hypothetical protein [Roseibacterium beibuensis]MCS6627202.1 hypothetical protein [Roseibacterium beibuensis]
MNTILKIASAGVVLFGATSALAQDATVGLDGPMRQVFAAPAVAGYMTAPTDDGSLKRTWTWLFLKDAIPNGADTLAMEWEIDCAAGTSRTVRTVLYTGAAHMKTDGGPAERSAPAAGSPGAITLAAACAPPAQARTTPVANAAAARAAANALFAAPAPSGRR